LAFVLFKTRRQQATWRVVWLGFLGFDLLVIAESFFRASESLPLVWRSWYFELSIGLPLTLLAAALLNALFRRQHVDWWTTVVSVPLLLGWGTQIAFKSIAT
jgi:ABC-type polysaccharide transport system permease subunit